MKNRLAWLLLFPLLGIVSGGVSAQQTQCVSNAIAGGTVDAIRIPLQPCALSTNILILTLAGANTIAQPTLQMAGYPVQNIYNAAGTAPGVGALPGVNATVMLTSTGSAWRIVSGAASTVFSGTLTVPNGGTGLTTITSNGIMIGQGTGAVSTVAAGTTGQFLKGNTSGPPSWGTISSNLVSSFTAGTTGLTPSSATTGAITLAGTLIPANGGTGLASYTTGDLLYASASATLAGLNDIATGNVLISGGTSTAPSYGKVGLTTHVTGTLAMANGGTGATSFASHGVMLGQGSSALAVTAAGATGQYLKGATGSDPTWGTLASDTVSTISMGTTGLTPNSATAGAVTVAGTLGFANGGTSNTSYTNGQLLIGNTSTGGLSKSTLTAGTNVTITNAAGGITIASTGLASGCGTGAAPAGQVLTADGATTCTANADATFLTGTLTLGVSTSEAGQVKLFGGTSGSTTFKAAAVAGTTTITFPGGTTDFSATGGTNQVIKQASAGAAFTVGTLACANLSDGATGCSTATGTSGATIPLLNVANTWSALQTFSAGINLSGASSPLQVGGSAGTSGQPLLSAGAGATPTYGTLAVASGGSGAVTLTGVLKGNGTSAFTAAAAGTDYVAPGTATTFTAKQTFAGTSSNLASALVNAAEPATIAATAATGTINFDVCTQSVLYFTSSAAANWTLNLRCSSGTSLNTAMVTGDVVTVVHLVTQGGTAYYNNVLTVDGGAVTPKCQGGTCPSAGNINGIDSYTYAIIKTGSAAFTVLEAQTQFK